MYYYNPWANLLHLHLELESMLKQLHIINNIFLWLNTVHEYRIAIMSLSKSMSLMYML